MPEHVHLLISEPDRAKLSLALQMLKQNVARRLREVEGGPFWQPRYYDFNVWSEAKRIEKLRYIHRNPVRRGLVQRRKIGCGAVFGTMLPGSRESSRLSHSGLRDVGSRLERVLESQARVKVPALSLQKAQRQGRGTLEFSFGNCFNGALPYSSNSLLLLFN